MTNEVESGATNERSVERKSYSPDTLLKTRICDLKLNIDQSPLKPFINSFREELKAKDVRLEPKLYLGDEWFSPEGVVAIAVPFYLADPQLIRLEKTEMLEAEGEDPNYFMKLLRHEAGHCFEHAYRFSKRNKWREVFGSPEKDYHPETYRPRPYSRSYVANLKNWYAQAHPDEDFAETFAVWLDPKSDWRKVYGKWPQALKKLEYIDELVVESRKIRGRKYKGEYLISNADRLKSTLATYYSRKRRENAQDYPDFYDRDLKRIFKVAEKGDGRLPKAKIFMRRYMELVLENVHTWTGEHKYVIEGLIRRLKARCQELDLRVHQDENQTLVMVSTYLCTLVNNYLFTGKFRRRI